MTALHQVFFEESFEGLNTMESALLGLQLDDLDSETINEIFRAAHSIKGGSGTFGFNRVAEFTHDLETLLDEIRAGKRAMTQQHVELFLQSVDILRDMLVDSRDEEPYDEPLILEMTSALRAALGKAEVSPAVATATATAVVQVCAPVGSRYDIEFAPELHLFATGNDPVRMFRELAILGDVSVVAQLDRLPSFEDIEPENAYLAWTLALQSAASEGEVREVFSWVEDDCRLTITATADEATPESADTGGEPADGNALALVAIAGGDRRAGDDRRQSADRRKENDYSSIRVGIDKVDAIINLVGELVITQSMLSEIGKSFDVGALDRLKDGLTQLERNTRELQESVLNIRMLPISFSFNRFPRLVRDLCQKLGKKIDLRMTGTETELDKTVLEKIGDPLVHLVRNCLDHGIEMPEVRLAAGKPETGVIALNAYHKGGSIVIEITDDGAGLDTDRILSKARRQGLVREDEMLAHEQIQELIFHPGLSTADSVSDLSGRGVGMDVVRRNIKDLGGDVEVQSKRGTGTIFRVRLPLTLAILDGQLVRVGAQIYIIPLVSIVESLQVSRSHVNVIAGRGEVYKLRDEYLPIVRLYEAFNVQADSQLLVDGLLVVVESDNQRFGVFVDDLLAQQQVVIKSLETNFRKIEGISGATILGDGTVALILDIGALLSLHRRAPKLRVASG